MNRNRAKRQYFDFRLMKVEEYDTISQMLFFRPLVSHYRAVYLKKKWITVLVITNRTAIELIITCGVVIDCYRPIFPANS
jgi:hypothetical protein